MRRAGTAFSHIRIFPKRLRSHSSSSAAFSKAMNSDFMVDLAIKDFQDIAAHPSVKTYPLVDFEFFESDILFASLYPSKTVGSLP